MSFHSDTVLVCQTPAKLIVYHHALELAFSCLQQCTLTYWGMFSLFISFQFLSAKCWCSVSIHTLIVVASTMFAEECCFSFLSLEHIQRVLCLQGSGLIMVKQQVVSWTDCVIHIFIYLITDFCWVTRPWYFPSYSVDFLYFLPGRILWKCCVGKRLPLNHLTMLCCHVAYLEKKYFFVYRSGVVNSVFNLLF